MGIRYWHSCGRLTLGIEGPLLSDREYFFTPDQAA